MIQFEVPYFVDFSKSAFSKEASLEVALRHDLSISRDKFFLDNDLLLVLIGAMRIWPRHLGGAPKHRVIRRACRWRHKHVSSYLS